MIKNKQHVYKGLVLVATMFALSACSKGGSNTVVGPATTVDELTAFNPDTGLPLKPEDLTTEMLKEDGRSEIETLDVHEVSVNVEKAKEIMLLGYEPNGGYNSHLSSQCHRSEVERMVASYSGKTSSLAQNLQAWANRCEKELAVGATNPISTVLRFANVKYDITGNTIKNVDIEFEDHSVIKAMLGLKQGKRPLVIVKAGVYSNANDGGVTRNFFMQLFDESPFHVLYLANVTGTEYMKTNGAVALGGMDEGQQILKIVDMLSTDPNYKDIIEDIHVVGVSLGSHGTLYSSLYNSYSGNSQHKLKSAVALCPVVNLEPTIKSVFETTIAGIYYAILTSQTFKEVYDYIPVLREYLDRNGLWTQTQMYRASTQATLWHYKERTSKTPLEMEPFTGRRVHELEDFWDLNNFIKYADKVTTPTLIVHSRDDFLVQSVLNSDELLKKTQNSNSQIGIVEFQNGAHCALNIAAGWPTMSSMLRSFILKHSTYKEEAGVKLTAGFSSPSLGSYAKITKYDFVTEKNNNVAQIKIKYFNGSQTVDGTSCRRHDPLFAPPMCYRTKTEEIDLNSLANLGVKVPTNDFEANRLDRWLNTHASLLNKNSDLVLGTNLWPTALEVNSKADFQ